LIAAPESTSGAAGDAGFVLDGVVLYRSELRPSGAVYTALRTFTLAPAAPA
jgi:2'-5' RNA ligase